MIKMLSGGLILLICLAVSTATHASPSFSFNGPYQYAANDGYRPVALTNNRYKRNDYEGVGAQLDLYAGFAARPEQGDSWFISLDRRDSGARLAQAKIHYDEQQDCYMMGTTALACGIRENSDAPDDISYAYLSVFFFGQCLRTEDYDLVLEYQLAGELLTPSYKSPFQFRPTRFRPKLRELVVPANLEPRRYRGLEGEAGDISIAYMDDLGCSTKVEGAEVTLTATVVGGTNGQTYFASGNRGTGIFTSLGYDAEVDVTSDFMGTKIKGYTDENGVFKARYQAQDHGAEETLKFDVKLPEFDGEPAYIGEATEIDITLSIMGLVQISAANGHFAFHDGKTCPHSPLPHWLTPTARSKMISLAAQYYYLTGRYLSLNDASLPLGGVIANQNGGGRDAACHKSHRQGIDIDLNGEDRHPNGNIGASMSSTYIEFNGNRATLLKHLTDLVGQLGGIKVKEEPIHYRFQ